MGRHNGESLPLAVGLELGPKRRVFAQVLGWAGWGRSGRSPDEALAALVMCGERYAQVAARAGLHVTLPGSTADLTIRDQVTGSPATDAGALSALLGEDTAPLDDADVARLASLLQACWATFDDILASAPASAPGTTRRKTRAPESVRLHVLEADFMHVGAFGPGFRQPNPATVDAQFADVRSQILAGLQAVPRGRAFTGVRRYGFLWTPHFAVRRSAWHALDHAWALQDRPH